MAVATHNQTEQDRAQAGTGLHLTPDQEGHVSQLMARPYSLEVFFEEGDDGEDGAWVAAFPDLPGLSAGAATWEQLPQKIADAKYSYFAALLAGGKPEPAPPSEVLPTMTSGKLVLRLPKSLHRQATRAAQRDGVSLNTWLVAAIAREIGPR